MKTRSSELINVEKARHEVSTRPKRHLRPRKLDDYILEDLEPVVKKQNSRSMIIGGASSAIPNYTVEKENTSKDASFIAMKSRSNELINAKGTRHEVSIRSTRHLRPRKLEDYDLEPVVKQNSRSMINQGAEIPNPTVPKESTSKDECSSKGIPIPDYEVGVGCNDDVCNLCGDGGEIVLCDGCPSAFHESCLQIENLPSGQWYCAYCLCKFCGALEHPAGALVSSEMTKCSMCEQNFHKPCVGGKNALNIDLGSLSFCGRECHEVYEKLQRFLGFKIHLEDGYSCTLVKHYDLGPYSTSFRRACNNKLATALKILNQCFKRNVDRGTGIDMIKNVVLNKGSKVRRVDFSGFFSVILEKDENMISVAAIRVHGNELAEMPYIGTSLMHRGKGMCRRLLGSIETILCALGVPKLVIPTVSPIWRNNFGFTPLEESTKNTMKSMSIVVFPGITMLQKHVQNGDNNLRQIKGSLI